MQGIKTQQFAFGPRRAVFVSAQDLVGLSEFSSSTDVIRQLEDLDLVYRTLCGILYNFVPTSGHPGGSISSGRIVESLFYQTMSYLMSDPDEPSADLISYAAGHKAMGLYAMWALRNEICAQFDKGLLPSDIKKQLRLEDLLGFRRNPTTRTPLFKKFNAKALDGHPVPLVPFLRLSTGASGVGIPSSFGLAFAARDYYGKEAPFVHVIEGEGGITPGRTQEAMASAASAQVNNLVLHLDWNQASIDSDRVCRDGNKPGDYVQWDPLEFGYMHDWNVIQVQDGFDFTQILAAQKAAVRKLNDQPTMIVYRTIKGWKYGIEGKGSHGAGHKFCSDEFYNSLKPFEDRFGLHFGRLTKEKNDDNVEELFWDHLQVVRKALGASPHLLETLGAGLKNAGQSLSRAKRTPRSGAPEVGKVFSFKPESIPAELLTKTDQQNTLRAAFGNVLSYLNKASNGAVLICSADLCGSTSIKNANAGFPDGFWNAVSNPQSRIISVGGICEDAMGALMAGVASFGRSVGAASSYGAFIAALQHIPARLHAIGQQSRRDYSGQPYNPFFIVCAHAGLKTGEDGPTHADPQPLQLLQENFPHGAMITLTPWEPNEMWSLVVAALNQRPAVIAPFVTRPEEKTFDRAQYKLPPLEVTAKGVYAIRRANSSAKKYHGTLVLQGSGEMNVFVADVLPKIDAAGLNMNVYYVSSVELFNALPAAEQESIFPAKLKSEAMGITGFTLPTMHRWIHSEEGLKRSLHPFRIGHYMGSGPAHKVLEESKLDGPSQWQAVQDYARWMEEK